MLYNILDYGAIADGITNNQVMIQKAIDDCSKTSGRVIIPPGSFLSGTIRLRSNVDLHLAKGSVLVASQNKEHIINFSEDTTVDGIAGGCFIYACHEKNITISGEGTLDGQGRNVYIDDNADDGLGECPLNVAGFRPRTTYLEDINGLTIKSITFYDACFWTLHMAGCKMVLVDGIKIFNNDRGPNNDGIDPDSCQDVIIRNCIVESGDDAIVLKTTKTIWEQYGNCENILISGCILHSRDSALKIGTETYGDVRKVVFSDCIVKDCSRAVAIWARDGGTIEDINVHHIIGNTRRYADCPKRKFASRWWGKGEPIFLSATHRTKDKKSPGKIRHIYFDNVRLYSESSIFIGGEENSIIEDITINNSRIVWKKQSVHNPNVFDEQPSIRDVYEHQIPWMYARYAKKINVSGQFVIDSFISSFIEPEEILENCEAVNIVRAD